MKKKRAMLFALVLCPLLTLAESAKLTSGKTAGDQSHKGVSEISIIGNTELPNVSFNLPWRLPSVANREDQSPIRELKNMLVPIEPRQHRKKVFFSQHLELDLPKLSTQR